MQIVDDPWMVREEDFPHDVSRREQMRFLLNFAVLAPSIYNTQPWVFRTTGDAVEVYADRSRLLHVSDPKGRQLVISCGAALMNLRVAIRRYGRIPIVKTFPHMDIPDLLASVKMGAATAPSAADLRLFAAIRKRRTHRAPFLDRPVPPAVVDRLRRAARAEGAVLDVVEQSESRDVLLSLIREADLLQGGDREFRRELADWVHVPGQPSGEGMDAGVHYCGDGLPVAGPYLVRNMNWGEGQAAADVALAQSAPLLAILSTHVDNPFEWLAAGESLAHILLLGRSEGLQASFLNQPVEVPALRSTLRSLLGGDRMPQIVFRMGYGQGDQHVPRRSVHDVLASF